jgi:hypothetical protein
MLQATAEAHTALQLATQPLDSHLSHMAAKRRLQQALNDTSASNPNPEWVTAWESQIKHVQDTFSNFQQTLKNTEPLVNAMPHPVENPSIKPENPDAYKLGKIWNATIHEFLAQSVIGWIFDKALQGQTKSSSGRRLHQTSTPAMDQNQLAMASSMTNVLNTLLAIATTFDGPGNDVEFPLEYLLDSNGEGSSARRLLSEGGPGSGNQHHNHRFLDKLRADWDKAIESMHNFHAGAKLKTAENDVAAKATGLKKRFEDLQTRIKSHFEGSSRHLLSEKRSHEPAPEEAASGNFLYVMPPVTKTTVVMLMPQREFNDSAAYVQDVLGFLTNFISSAFAPLSPPTTGQGFPLQRPHSTRRIPHPPAQEDGAIAVQRRKRQLLSGTEEYVTGGDKDKYYYEEFEQDAYGGYNAEDDAWMWGNDDNEWANGQVEGDEALYSATPTMPTSMELVIRLLTPTENGVVSPELISLLSDPEGATLAQVLTEMSMAPAGSELVFSNSPAKDVSSEATGPRLPLFGPSVKVGPAQSSASSFSSSQSLEEERRKAAQRQAVAELVIKPLKGPTAHNNGDSTPILMDARWWGVALGLGGMGLLLVATALSGMKP